MPKVTKVKLNNTEYEFPSGDTSSAVKFETVLGNNYSLISTTADYQEILDALEDGQMVYSTMVCEGVENGTMYPTEHKTQMDDPYVSFVYHFRKGHEINEIWLHVRESGDNNTEWRILENSQMKRTHTTGWNTVPSDDYYPSEWLIVDTLTNFQSKWDKSQTVETDKDSTDKFPSTKATYDFVQDEFARREPVVVWETDGTTGLLGLNTDWVADDGWQVTGVDLTPFKRVKFYVKPNRDNLSKNRLTPPAVCEVFLDDRSTSEYTSGEYIGTYIGASPADHNVLYSCIFVVSADKTKFKFQTQNSLYGTTKGGRNDNGRFCYLCEGYYY